MIATNTLEFSAIRWSFSSSRIIWIDKLDGRRFFELWKIYVVTLSKRTSLSKLKLGCARFIVQHFRLICRLSLEVHLLLSDEIALCYSFLWYFERFRWLMLWRK